MKSKSLSLAILLAATLAATAKEPKHPAERRPPPHPLLPALDINRDGELSAGEISNTTAVLTDLDTDGDGTLAAGEIAPKPPKGRKPKVPGERREKRPHGNGGEGKKPPFAKNSPPPILAALDRDKDGSLSGDEIDLAPESLATLDTEAK